MKMLMSFIVSFACSGYVIFQEKADASIVMDLTQNGIVKPDNAYPVSLNLLPVGLKNFWLLPPLRQPL